MLKSQIQLEQSRQSEELWEYIEGVSRACNLPWLVVANMNEVRGSR